MSVQPSADLYGDTIEEHIERARDGRSNVENEAMFWTHECIVPYTDLSEARETLLNEVVGIAGISCSEALKR
ncbi:hypothetical protein [Haloarcula sp. Atlit-120R]|uniref:hypothetical protein n=1 Tax=Haloarcula sp. Atlit-120R TaxID=2282135 RepID=UPI000EF1A828|nr:hypothetical protein [Haloarcula sp. Atlit-120R]RLM32672.1 hypothetical protein DVK01_20590 [Haloarcula sp. Atlit-120R]